jgi:hypothetical protein
MNAICVAAGLTWALVWHAPPGAGVHEGRHPASSFGAWCFSVETQCAQAAGIANEAFLLAGAPKEQYRAECVEQPARKEP